MTTIGDFESASLIDSRWFVLPTSDHITENEPSVVSSVAQQIHQHRGLQKKLSEEAPMNALLTISLLSSCAWRGRWS